MISHSKKYKVTTNDAVFFFDEKDLAEPDLIQIAPDIYNVIQNHQSVNAIVLAANSAEKKYKINIAGEIYAVEIKDELDQRLEKMGFGVAVQKQLTQIKAPMPGMVLEIAVTEGESVGQGEKVLILEAMKMENSILMPASAVIKKILVKKGEAVVKGQVMVELQYPPMQ